MERKIVILGNATDWCQKSLNDINKYDNIKLLNSNYLCDLNKIQQFLIKIQFSYKLNHIFNVPLKRIWFKKVRKNISLDKNDNLLIIVYDRSFLSQNEKFIKYLRNYYKDCKIVYLFTNIVKYSGAKEYNFVEKLNKVYDLVYAFDYEDAKKYNFKYNPLIYSENEIKDNKKNVDVFYVGKAKDRYDMLIKCFEKINKIKLKAEFYIFGINEKKQKYNDQIKYNQYIPYVECLENIKASNCLLDIIQGDSSGYTIKVCEAIFYNKLLITTNKNIKNAPFYNPKYILIIENENDIKREFFDSKDDVKYTESDRKYFLLNTFLMKINNDLKEGKIK